MLHLYGIPNCQTVKKARTWLDENAITYVFHNFKTEIPTAELLNIWLKSVSLDSLVNKRGTTWRKLTENEQKALQDASSAIDVLIANTSVIKRPIAVLNDGKMILGFDVATYEQTFLAP